MYSAFNKIMWGIVFIFIDINIGNFDLIPDFIGYLLIISSITYFKNKYNYKEFTVSLILFYILLIDNFISMFIVSNININGMNNYLSIGFFNIVIGMMLHGITVYYMYSGIIRIIDNISLRESATLFRNTFLIITLISSFAFTFLPNVNRDITGTIIILATISNLIIYFFWIFNIKKIRNYYTNN